MRARALPPGFGLLALLALAALPGPAFPVEPRYSAVRGSLADQPGAGEGASALQGPGGTVVVLPGDFLPRVGARMATAAEAQGRPGAAVLVPENGAVTVPVDVRADGLYELLIDYYPLDPKPLSPEIAVAVDSAYPFRESRRIVLPVRWISGTPPQDRYGNELLPVAARDITWYTDVARDASGLMAAPLTYSLHRGRTVLVLTNLQGPFLLGTVRVRVPARHASYADYVAAHPGGGAAGGAAGSAGTPAPAPVRIEAEAFAWRSSASVRAIAERNPGLVPYDTRRQVLNAVDGDSWKLGGQQAAWNVAAPADGWYQVVLVARQKDTDKARTPVFRALRVDGDLPFAEAASLKIRPSAAWANLGLELESGEVVRVWLTKGTHELSLTVDESRARPVLETAEDVLDGIRDLAIAVRKITGNSTDPYRDWTITDFLPDAPGQLLSWADTLDRAREHLSTVVGAGERSRESLSLRQSSQILRRLAAEPDEIPRSLNRLSEGSGSVGTVLGELLTLVAKQPLTVEALWLAPPGAALPRAGAGFVPTAWEGLKRFMLSFLPEPYVSKDAPKASLRVWVYRPRQYVPLIQSLADETFTPVAGVTVTLSLTVDEGKLILANAAGRQPDVVISSANQMPFDLGVRGALLDLRPLPGFSGVVRRFAPGALLTYVVDDSVYALPETQDFWVLFYRKDILDALGLEVPDTWEDVTRMLPVLQRFGMNFYSPLSGAGSKSFMNTVPFIYQFGGDLYRQEPAPGGGMVLRAAIDSEAALKGMQLMSGLFTLYSLPMQTPVFYDSFRSAKLPIGVANFTEYLKLVTAAPEIAGWWTIAPQPGIRDARGVVERWAPGSAQAAYIFKSTAHPGAAWDFLKWWTSTETQVAFQDRLRSSYGAEYLWPSANVEAFKQLPIPAEHRAVVLEQWRWMREVARAPGSYMLEREISNTWNRIVFNGENPRSAVDDAVVTINRELARKLEEFGYMKGGTVVRPWRIPDIPTIESWGRGP